MHIHILGICGTFMAGIANIAKQAGHLVVGSDANVYPPMSTMLEAQGITVFNGYDAQNIDASVDQIIVGNVIRRGNPMMEYILEKNLPYISGPQWLYENVLRDRWVLAVAGTHGKTTTTSLLTWILEHAGLNPGFLIGGIPENFGVSARIGNGPFFVIEADEYDSAFFDKRSKFIHYRPKTLVLNNLEFDHLDIFPNLEAIQQQFHYLVRTIPGNGLIICNDNDIHLRTVLDKGCWTPIHVFGAAYSDWRAEQLKKDGSAFTVMQNEIPKGEVKWNLLGTHNVDNALAAIAAASHVGVPIEQALTALPLFKNVKRRLEVIGEKKGITLYDDFAHHPTAIATTLAGLRAKVGSARIVVVLEFGSYTMRSGVHNERLKDALSAADVIICKQPEGDKGELESILKGFEQSTTIYSSVDRLIEQSKVSFQAGDHIVIMSNSGFGGIHQKLLNAL
ncbi:MAG: UDP-N-acetylmuramate:L-alanyl-gamma-D-glutamyl-meso-diaminopimelate ligase [Gammaproteobacteria bacterium]|nr:UDP-N-acetylmuramate:L-alanyl-gamma-D-glutamyl-meso-diaminopimelate ligase [Gammaproteobacteria bacterium]